MVYEPQQWENLPAKTTPFSAERMLHIEYGTRDTSALADAIFDTVTSGRLSSSGVAATATSAFVGEIGRYDIRSALLAGETLARNKSQDVSAIMQRAIDAAALIYNLSGKPQQVFVPAGEYRINTALIPKSGVGIKGAGKLFTSFFPQGDQNFMVGGLVSVAPAQPIFNDNVFEDFTVNCYDQFREGGYSAGVKAFYIQNMLRPRWIRVACMGSWASQFGCDFLVEAEFVDCYSLDSGRGGPSRADGTGSGFAVGIGRFANESYRYINCVAEGSRAGGWFFERLDTRDALNMINAISLVGCTSQYNQIGMNDCGAGGILAVGSSFSSNAQGGWLVRPGNSSGVGGRDAQIVASRFVKNGSSGIRFNGQEMGGGYRVLDTQFIENVGQGIFVESPASFSDGGITVRGNAFLVNGGSGVRIEGTGKPIAPLIVEDNLFDGNGAVSTTDRSGLFIAAASIGMSISRNQFTDQKKSGRQAVGLDLRVSSAIAPRVQSNTFIDQATPYSGLSAIDQSNVTGNAIGTTPSNFVIASDTFTRADGPIGRTESGDLPYTTTGGATGNVVSNTAQLANVGNALSRLLVDTGAANGTFKIKFSTLTPTREQGMIVHFRDVSNELSINARVDSGNLHWRVCKRIAGALSTVQELDVLSASGDVVEARMSGTTLTVVINGVQKFSSDIPDYPYSDKGVHGVFVTGSTGGNARFDDLSMTAT